MYRHWHNEQDEFTKIVLKTEMASPPAARKQEDSVPA
jgi:hypothetical protein